MNQVLFILSRLWRYHNVYFLKPFDAINDTLTSSLLSTFDWSESILEIGSGDGVFSFIMHGGKFSLEFDRYLITDLTKKDIYDKHYFNIFNPKNKLDKPHVFIGLDAKRTHVLKIKEIKFARHGIEAAYENLPFASGSVEKIFFYTPHGLRNHEEALREASRVLCPGGSCIILLFSENVKSSFVAYRSATKFKGFAKSFFKGLDNGRHDEITKIAKSFGEWSEIFERNNLYIEKWKTGLSSFAWKVYDIQTRPFLHYLIRTFNFLPKPLRMILKIIWMACWYPLLIVFYILFSNEYLKIDSKNCYLAFSCRKN